MTDTDGPGFDAPGEPAWDAPSVPPAMPAAASNLVPPSAPGNLASHGARWGVQPIAVAGLAVALVHLRPEETYSGPLIAPVGKRILAFFLDTVLAWAVTAAGLFAGIAMFGSATGGVPAVGFGLLGLYLLLLVVIVGRTGLTAGKVIVGLRVLNADSLRPIGFGPAFVRGILIFPLSLFPAWMLLLVISTVSLDASGRNRGWHDKAARAIVVDTRRGADPVVDPSSDLPLARAN